MVNINWFPGHMSKARIQVQEKLKYVDFVIELVDSRLPISSRNPMLNKIIGDKPRLIALNKADLSDPIRIKEWVNYFKAQGMIALAINSKEQNTSKLLANAGKKLMAEKTAHNLERGIINTSLRTMIVGIPNAGKSTLMNRLAGRKVAITGNKPGVTKGQQWIKTRDLDILDTPGILWPKFEDDNVAMKLALTGAIKDQVLPIDEVTIWGLSYFTSNYPKATKERYKLSDADLEEEIPELIMKLTAKYGFRDDYDRFYSMFIKDVRDGKLGTYCLDRVSDFIKSEEDKDMAENGND